MTNTSRFKVKQKGNEWLIFDTLSPAKRYIGVVTLVKHANQLQKMALRWVDKLKASTEENATLKAQLATLQEALDTTVSYMSQEVARLQEELDEWNEMAVTPKQHLEELEARDDEVLTLKAKLMLSKAYVSEFTRVGATKIPITYEVYINPGFSLEVTSRNGWRAIGYSEKFNTAVDVMKWYIETHMNCEVAL